MDWKWGINFPELAVKLSLPQQQIFTLFSYYNSISNSKSFTKDDFKTKYLRLKKDDGLNLDGLCDRVFRIYDPKSTGKINFEEFAALLHVQFYGSTAEKLTLLFELTDQDGNGLLSEKELTDMLTVR